MAPIICDTVVFWLLFVNVNLISSDRVKGISPISSLDSTYQFHELYIPTSFIIADLILSGLEAH